MALKIITTSDGSHSLLNEELNETYHSIHGAIQESKHVFIEHGLCYYLQNKSPEKLSILEIGFGTGLNAYLTVNVVSQQKVMVTYTTLEAFPLEKEIWSTLNYAETELQKEIFSALHEGKWEIEIPIHSNLVMRKLHVTLQQVELPTNEFDLVYFDAFAPSKQPELWTFTTLQKVTNAMKPGGVFVTYCAKGQLKRDLKALGCTVESLPGPPGKMEMVRATKLALPGA